MFTFSIPPACLFALVANSATIALAVPALQRLSLLDDALSNESSFGFPIGTAPLQTSPQGSEEPSSWMMGNAKQDNSVSKPSLGFLSGISHLGKPSRYQPECSRGLYGRVHINSCKEPFDDIPQYEPTMKWCNRGQEGECGDRILPLRLTGSEFSAL